MAADKATLQKIGRKIDALRQTKGMSFQELANKAGIEKSNLVKICSEGKNVTVLTLLKIAEGLGVHPRELLDF